LHAVPGGQNQDWHSDSGISEALFWRFREFQDRAINLWVEIAKRYKGNPYVYLTICFKVKIDDVLTIYQF
jgi:aryl-phospho-beta-D-glucosidase BglC (GH1 family)